MGDSSYEVDINMNSQKIKNLAAPTDDNDAVRKIDMGGVGIHASSHEVGGADLVDHDNLTNSPTNTGAQIDTAITASTNHIASDGSDHSDVVDNTSARHTQNTDTALGSGCVAADHGVAATDQVINVCYGTGDPPTASDTTEGTLFVKYTA